MQILFMTCISGSFKYKILFSYLPFTKIIDNAFLISIINLRSHGLHLNLLITLYFNGTITDIQISESESNYNQYKSKLLIIINNY